MKVYKFKNQNELNDVKEDTFKLEKDMQNLIERNLKLLFGLEFIKSEFSLNNFRIDTLAFDNGSNSFVVIEYKKDKNFSIIDQGYAYLSLMLNNKADVENVVRSVKYRPEGRRGLAGVRVDGWGIAQPLSEYVVEANRETLVMTQVETMEAVENLKDFLTIPEIDVVFVGPTDLSSAMGFPGQVKRPEVQDMVEKLVKEIRAAGKAAGTVAYDIDTMKKRKEQGFQFIVYNVVPMIVKSGREYLQIARE